MFRFLFLAFLLVPLGELYVLIAVGSEIGAPLTIGLCLATAALGATLVRRQGIETLGRVRARLAQGEMPATDLIEAFILLLAGMLLLTPGFLTDMAGFCCLVPRLRTRIATALLGHAIVHGRPGQADSVTIIEGEFHEVRETPPRIDRDEGER